MIKPDDRVAAKRRFYSADSVARGYDQQRFGGRSGQYVNQREIGLVEQLLPAGRRVIDVGAGTGRVAFALTQRGREVVSCDPSLAMLHQGVARGLTRGVQGDGFALPFVDQTFDGAVALRLLFHFEDVEPLLREMHRIVQPGGTLVCDTYSWSVRALLPVQAGRWGPSVYATRPRDFATTASKAGWRIQREVACFLTSPYIYRLLPEKVSLRLETWEARMPRRLLARIFWALEAT